MTPERQFNRSWPPIFEEIFQKEELEQLDSGLYRVSANFDSRPRGSRVAIALTGPTGSGKDTIRNLLPSELYLPFKTCTTRPRRPEEPEGDADPYFRLTQEEFASAQERGEFFEANNFVGRWYGGRFADIDAALSLGLIPVFRPDPQGAANYLEIAKTKKPPFDDLELLVVFILPPKREQIAQQLYERDVAPFHWVPNLAQIRTETGKRLVKSETEIDRAREAHYILVNHSGQPDSAALELVKLIHRYHTQFPVFRVFEV